MTNKTNKYYIGIDTSAYTTSVAVLNQNNEIIKDLRKVLHVRKGQKGLRQQEAVFQHLNNITELLSDVKASLNIENVQAVGVTTKPRNNEESYMPVFMVSKNIGKIISDFLNVKYFEFSHQEGHIASGILGSDFNADKRFISMHISGGTTELLLATKNRNRFDISIVGGTKDISIGQLIDRIGVKLEIQFPCGNKLDKLSSNGKLIDISFPFRKNDDTWTNLSGLETYFMNLISKNKYSKEDIAKTLFHSIYKIISNILYNTIKKYNISECLIVGGVASNSYIKKLLLNNMEICEIYFPNHRYCTDNALGTAYLCKI